MTVLCDMRFPHFRWKKPGRGSQNPAEKTQGGATPAEESPPMLSLPQKSFPVTERPAPPEEGEARPPAQPQPEKQPEKRPETLTQSPFGTTGDAAVDKDIKVLWVEVQGRVAALAHRQGESVNTGMRIDDVLANLRTAQNEDEPPSGKQKVKETFGRALTVIEKVGGVVAGAASNVFAPASDCFNVISFAINAYRGYQGAFESLGGLLGECTDYLDRLPYQIEGKMDAKLTKLASQQLRLFIQTCEAAIDLQDSVKSKIKTFLTITFLDEDRIQPLVAEMQILLQREDKLISSQTFMRTGKIEDSTKRMEGYLTEMTSESKDNHRDKVIKRALGFQTEPAAIWRSRYSEYSSQRLKSTGDWIFKDRAFANWEKGQSAVNVLAVEGDSSTGKSILASAIIRHLMHVGQMENTEILTGYYFLEGREREVVKSATNLETVAKSLVWQFTRSYRPYMKSASKICGQTQEIDPAEISRDLLFGNSDLHDMNAVLYIVIDGLSGKVGEGMLKFLRRASTAKAGRRIRVLVTVDPQCRQHLTAAGGIEFKSIPISANNRTDVDTFIRSRLDSMSTLSDKSRPGIQDLRDKIRNELYRVTRGDYFKINLALDDISKRERVSDIDKALSNAGNNRSVQVNKEIEWLNHNRSEAEISEINEIVLWIRRYRELLTERKMTAALYANGREPSLLRLQDKFKERYPLFQITNKGEVAFRVPEVEKSIVSKQESTKANEKRGAEVVSTGEIAMVDHFLRTVCPQGTYDKLDLDKFLEQKKQVQDSLIYKESSHTEETKVALTCLRVLTGEAAQHNRELLSYARSYFIEHLSIPDLALVDIELKSSVGARLVNLFTHDVCIDILLQTDEQIGPSKYQRKIARRLLFDNETARVVLRWLRDSAVASGIDNEETRSWISGLAYNEDYRGLLAPTAKRMAVHLVQKPHFRPLTRDAFLFAVGFLQKFRNGDGEEDSVSINQVKDVETWCEEVLEVEEKDSTWHTQIGTVLKYFEHAKLAEDRARLALEADPEDWRASTLLAELVVPNKRIEILKPAAQRVKSSDKWKQSPLHRMGLAKMLFILAELQWKEGNMDAAIDSWKKAMKVDFTDYKRVFKCLESYYERERWSDIMEALQTITANSTEQRQGLEELLIVGSRDMQSVHMIILRAALHTENLQHIACAYERSIEILEERGDRKRLGYAQYHYGRAIKALQTHSSPAIEQWCQALKYADSYLLSMLISNIAPYYMRKASGSGQDPETVAYYLDKIETLIPESVLESEVMLPPRVYVARYYVRQGDMARAKQIVRDMVKVCLDILTDDIEENDLHAYNQLIWIFIPLNDYENIKAIHALTARLFGEDQEVNCDGDCNRSWDLHRETSWCQDCVNVNFESECLQKVKQGRLPFSGCNESHQFIHVPDVDLTNAPDGCVPAGDGWIPVENLFARIEKDYVYFDD